MQASWRIGSIFGIPLFIDYSWFFILALITLANALDFSTVLGPVLGGGAGLLMALLLFGSVLLHELGHSLVARKQGIQVNSITLFLFGGIASIEQESKTPGEAFQVAIAGPAVSFVLWSLFYLVAHTLPVTGIVQVMTLNLAKINLILALFNLIPGLPLDGGQVVKAAVWKATGNRFQGVRWAAKFGLVLGWGAIALGMAIIAFNDQWFNGFWIGLLGWFGIRNATSYERMSTLQETLLQIIAADAMQQEFRVVDANMTLRQFADGYILEASHFPVYFAASEGRYRGLVSVDDLHFIERSRWETETLQSIVHPLTEIATVEEKTPIAEVINFMEAKQLNRITVLSPAGAVAGVIDRGDIVRAVAAKLNLAISDADIKRVKAEASYPASLQLNAIAKAATLQD
ncbi:site-2 protease family protein [Funiculus sociatus GB2-A5]|uniref:Zinc metalloprotease n=1 Tax=Funiculus sociatus GB2-A5 TaxID=2933946 RepID=A0ABV0JKP8_9CYAN|nr:MULTISPECIES: site-2 protease family protein [unclassified Trichocoleus]MBD1906206.1 site-2 protease family protein [Trichocoleus sp. FACHB-832]MBD2061371.1 site-2 protease family protein [Trichocoleus sp. FACHB-6]